MKGQAAMEFLLTYGWAILVVILMISSLAYFGVFDIDDFIPDKCFFSAGIGCEDYIVYDQGTKTNGNIILMNNLGETIIPSKVNITDINGVSGCSCNGGMSASDCGIAGGWKPSMTKTLNFSCSDNIQRVDLRIRITYKFLRGDYDRVIEGKLQSNIK